MSASQPSRVVILAVRPEVDSGRYPVKRIANEPLAVEADIVIDGHDLIAARLLHRHESEAAWTEVELVAKGNDTWAGEVSFEPLGVHYYTVVGWIDRFATWHHGFERKVAAGVDVSVELLELAALVEGAAARADHAAATIDRDLLVSMASALRTTDRVDRIAIANESGLADAMARHPDRSTEARYARELAVVVERPLAGSAAWYELFPRSTRSDGKHGTLRDTEAWLPYVRELGFDILYLPPIHPIGLAYRKGPDNSSTAGPDDPGSPWAIGAKEGGHTAVHPSLGTLADFDRLVAAARTHDLEIAIDIAFQASPDHPWVKEHPSWFKQRPDGTIQYAENPPKKYQDVYPFDFDSVDRRELWNALRDVFLFWADHGVRCFRVDNPHTKPIPFWEWCIREVKQRHPDTMFLSEAFTRPKLAYALAKVGFSQSYTYFTWRTSKYELTRYLEELFHTDVVEFFRPCFWPTTPDIFPEHLVHGGQAAFASRLVLASTLVGTYGIYGPSYELMEHVQRQGAEELAQNEKYQLRTWDRDRPESLRYLIARINRVRREHPALAHVRSLRFHPTDNDLVLCYSKRTPDRGDVVLVVVNLDPHHTHSAWLDLDLAELGIEAGGAFQVHDLIGDSRYVWQGSRNYVELVPDAAPAHVFEVRRRVRTEHQFDYFL